MLLEDPYESLTKLYKLEQAFEAAVKHIVFKAENDSNLQSLENFQSDVRLFVSLHQEFKVKVDERISQYKD